MRSIIPCSLSPLLLVSTLVFYPTGGVLCHLNFLTHRFPRFPPRNLCCLVTLVEFSLVFAATDTSYCLALISLGLAESRILLEAPADTRPRTPLISFSNVQQQNICAAGALWRLSVSLLRLVQTLGSCSAFGLHDLSRCSHSSEGIE